MYIPSSYPRMLYHMDGPQRVVQSADEEAQARLSGFDDHVYWPRWYGNATGRTVLVRTPDEEAALPEGEGWHLLDCSPGCPKPVPPSDAEMHEKFAETTSAGRPRRLRKKETS